MTFSMKRMYAIFQKDVRDLSKNMYITTTMLMPLALAIFYSTMDEVTMDMHYLIINLCFAAVGVFVQSAIIAEEKEKNTLRGLMLSPATLPEILGGKSLVTLVLTMATVLICALLMGYEPANYMIVGGAILISCFFYIALGTLVGLLTKSVVEASVLALPVMFIFSFGSLFLTLIEEYPILSFIEYLPSVQLVELAIEVETGAVFADLWSNFAIILAWIVLASLLTAVVYKKKEMDA
ncbi:ABC transporter permease [Oceanobacillus manasiensis]|uniref:ABC transporter permease n=1 Tax=Oceanobacillus manasiensis TaxID=586413 RepID=UPI0005AA1D2E|nr:ABC transporter permease [Oceanobacillus manasiensis]